MSLVGLVGKTVMEEALADMVVDTVTWCFCVSCRSIWEDSNGRGTS